MIGGLGYWYFSQIFSPSSHCRSWSRQRVMAPLSLRTLCVYWRLSATNNAISARRNQRSWDVVTGRGRAAVLMGTPPCRDGVGAVTPGRTLTTPPETDNPDWRDRPVNEKGV